MGAMLVDEDGICGRVMDSEELDSESVIETGETPRTRRLGSLVGFSKREKTCDCKTENCWCSVYDAVRAKKQSESWVLEADIDMSSCKCEPEDVLQWNNAAQFESASGRRGPPVADEAAHFEPPPIRRRSVSMTEHFRACEVFIKHK